MAIRRLPHPGPARAKHAVTVTFAGAGASFATLASRIPQIRAGLGVSPGVLGLILLCASIGAMLAIPLSGLLITWLGDAVTVAVTSVIGAAGLAIVGIGCRFGIAPVAAGMFVTGAGGATCDVAMNVQGAAVERELGRAIMPRFHAGWSLGTVAAAGIGAIMVALRVPVTAHLLAVAVAAAVAMPASARSYLPAVPPPGDLAAARHPFAAWTETRTLLIGLFILCVTVSEAVGNDWLSLAVIDGYHTAVVAGTLSLAVFLAGMTAGRWFGPRFIDRYGRVAVLRVCVAIALAGVLTISFSGILALAVAGAAAAGIGTSLGFPVGLSAAADDPRAAPGRVSTASSLGYLAFLGTPPVVGFLSDGAGVRYGISVAAGLLLAAMVLSSATTPLAPPGQPAPSAGAELR